MAIDQQVPPQSRRAARDVTDAPSTPRLVLPWHLRKRFVLPVAAVLLLAALVTLSGVIVVVVLVVTTAGAFASLAGLAGVSGTGTVDAVGPITYEVTSSVPSTVSWQSDADGALEYSESALEPDGWSFTLEGTQEWDGAYLSVEPERSRGAEVSCRIVDAEGTGLAEAVGMTTDAPAICAWERP